ncbi:MAG: DUF2807 domain-containing protein [Saprospiraceae bacterium]|nr:DUF2807 domain-containing protein [Saprospiraceae bacterium]
MRHILSLFFVLVVSALSFAQEKSLTAFTKINASGNVDVELIQDDNYKATFTMTEGEEEDLVLDVKDGVLSIKIKSKKGKWNRSEAKAEVQVYYKKLESIQSSAGASVSSASTVDAAELIVDVSSGANCHIPVNANLVKAEVSSGGRLNLRGKTVNAIMDSSSGSNLDAQNMIAENVTADASSGGNIKLNATKSLTADASSGGSIRYKGKPDKLVSNAEVSGSVKAL